MTDLPVGWEATTLGAVAEVKLGRQRSPKNHTGDRMRPYIRAANVTWSGLDLSDVKEMNFTEKESETFQLRPGDIVMSEASGSASEVGKAAIWSGEIDGCCFQNTLLRVRSHGPDPRFLLHLLQGEARLGRFGDAARGVGIHHLGAQRLNTWPVWLPPIDQQHRIVAGIEEQFSHLEQGEAALHRASARLDALRSSAVASVLAGDWPEVPWSECGSSQNGRAFPSRDYSETGVRLLRPGNLAKSGRLSWTDSNTRHLPEVYATSHPNHIVGPGEIVMNLTAQSLKDDFLGRVCMSGPEDRCLLNQRIARLTPTPDLDPEYLLWVFKSRPFRRFVESLNTGSLIQHMFTSQLAQFPVPMPPLDDQRRMVGEISRVMSSFDSIEGGIVSGLARARGLRRSVLQSAFSGALLPEGPDRELVISR